MEMQQLQWKALPLRDAYRFGSEHGLSQEVAEIRDMEIEWDLSYTSSLRSGYIVELFKSKGVFNDFKNTSWPNGNTTDGERRIRRYLKIRQQYQDFLSSGQVSVAGGVDEGDSDQEFAAEDNLRDFLAEHLGVIEPGLILYEDQRGKGIEYPVEGGRIDLLARDATGRFVVIELKVSRGRNPVIGQLAYYMAWVDANLSSKRGARGIVIAKEIPDDLILASKRVPDIFLYKYNLSVTTAKVYPPDG